MKLGKIWGETQEFFNNGIVSVNHLKVKKGGYCSEHKHVRKSNIFFIISGSLAIEIWRGDTKDWTVIEAGEMTTVEPGVYHKFRAITDVECLEVYEVRFDGEDIERRIVGGKA